MIFLGEFDTKLIDMVILQMSRCVCIDTDDRRVADLSGKSEELCARIVSSLILSKHIDLDGDIMLF